MQQPSMIACFFLIYTEIVMIKKGKGGSFLCDISYIIFKCWDNAN
jgi:hypothetical protein